VLADLLVMLLPEVPKDDRGSDRDVDADNARASRSQPAFAHRDRPSCLAGARKMSTTMTARKAVDTRLRTTWTGWSICMNTPVIFAGCPRLPATGSPDLGDELLRHVCVAVIDNLSA
jgi:hypothetical protein